MDSHQLAKFFPQLGLDKPMSKQGRRFLDFCVTRSRELVGRNTQEWDNLLLQFNSVIYEDAVVRYDFNIFRKHVNSEIKNKTIGWKELLLLKDNIFVGLYSKPTQIQARIWNIPDFQEIYLFFQNWLLGDFSKTDLLLIVDLSKKGNREEIENCADLIKDTVQRSVAYLAAIFDKRKQALIVDLKEQADVDDKTKDTFSRLFAIHIQPVLPNVPEQIETWLDGIDIERALLDERRKLDNK